jgi:hypothetical protein
MARDIGRPARQARDLHLRVRLDPAGCDRGADEWRERRLRLLGDPRDRSGRPSRASRRPSPRRSFAPRPAGISGAAERPALLDLPELAGLTYSARGPQVQGRFGLPLLAESTPWTSRESLSRRSSKRALAGAMPSEPPGPPFADPGGILRPWLSRGRRPQGRAPYH